MRSFRPTVVALALLPTLAAAQLPPVPAPPENPITAAKAVLGKALFWEEQLSSDDTMSCGTCHRPEQGGVDPRAARHPGRDARANTPDDKLGSAGVARTDAQQRYTIEALFGLEPQATRRAAPTTIGAAHAPQLFWDGRAQGRFVDPLTQQVAVAQGGALESQALGPILDAVEMAHEGRTWAQVVTKLAQARPLALATDLPPDLASALAAAPSYPDLFRAAFGDGAVTPVRIAFALATYQRTLVADRTPFDLGTMTQRQRGGLQALQGSRCADCHRPPLFTDHTFRNIGLRPIAEDAGRQEVTNAPPDRGRFKVPTLRNVGLRPRFMHHGQLATLAAVLDHYEGLTPRFADNLDPIVPLIRIPPPARTALLDFLQNALTDPRAAARAFPFDRPTLRSERPGNRTLGQGTSGSGGFVPRQLSGAPAFVGSTSFKIGVASGRGGAPALLLLSGVALEPPQWWGAVPLHVAPQPAVALPFLLGGAAAAPGEGLATVPLPVPATPALRGLVLAAQAFVADPAAVQGVAASAGAVYPIE